MQIKSYLPWCVLKITSFQLWFQSTNFSMLIFKSQYTFVFIEFSIFGFELLRYVQHFAIYLQFDLKFFVQITSFDLKQVFAHWFDSYSFFFSEIMSKDDSHSITINLPGCIGYTIGIPILFLKDYEVRVMHFEDYITGIETHGSSIWQAIIKVPHPYSKTKPHCQ